MSDVWPPSDGWIAVETEEGGLVVIAHRVVDDDVCCDLGPGVECFAVRFIGGPKVPFYVHGRMIAGSVHHGPSELASLGSFIWSMFGWCSSSQPMAWTFQQWSRHINLGG